MGNELDSKELIRYRIKEQHSFYERLKNRNENKILLSL